MALKESYDDCLETMYGLRRFGIILGLSTIKNILKGLKNPQNSFRCIHVAGTNGKGSIASALASILYFSGYKVGLYTSPHLVGVNERIHINNQPISDEDVVVSYKAVKRVHHGEREPTFFEFSTAMAFHEFGRQKGDWAVIETGMGGRLDATNIIKPAISIISNISLEHQMYLGNTIAQIAGEKGGIIKKKSPVVTGVKQKKAIAVLKEIACSKSAPFYRLGDAFRIRRSKNNTFSYFGIDQDWRNMQAGLTGSYQVDNAALVLAACEVLNRDKAAQITIENIKDGLAQNRWPGRLEIASNSPLILLDGAHNLSAAKNLAKFLAQDLSGRKITLIVGILNDKPYSAMLRHLLPVCHRAILTSAKSDRAIAPEKLYSIAKKLIPDLQIIPDVGEAIKYAVKTTSTNDAICISGSLYVVGEAKKEIERLNFYKKA